jgi:malonyl-CoA O-methyltransferase
VRTDVREVFAVAARAYDRGNPLLAVERPETQALLPPLFGHDVLDLGSGRGHYATLARASGATRVVALDLTPEMLEAAPPPAVIADACRLPLADQTFDVVIAALVMSYVADPSRALREAARVLRPGGVIVASELHPVAAVKGWRRRFHTDDGGWVETDAAPPRIDQWKEWVAEAGLHLDVLREPVVGPALEPYFRHAGRRDFDALSGTPLLVVFRVGKGGRP